MPLNYVKTKRNLKIRKYMCEIILTLLGCLIMATGISLFLLPNQLSTGGFSGIATIGYYLLKIPMGLTIFILNVPLFILGYKRLGKVFIVKTIIGTLMLSTFIDILDNFTPLTEDKFLASVFGGIIVGIGSAINLKATASTGGSDLLAYIIRSFKPHYQTSFLIIIIDVIIVGLNVIFLRNLEIG